RDGGIHIKGPPSCAAGARGRACTNPVVTTDRFLSERSRWIGCRPLTTLPACGLSFCSQLTTCLVRAGYQILFDLPSTSKVQIRERLDQKVALCRTLSFFASNSIIEQKRWNKKRLKKNKSG